MPTDTCLRILRELCDARADLYREYSKHPIENESGAYWRGAANSYDELTNFLGELSEKGEKTV